MLGFFQRAYDWLAGFGRYIRQLVLDIFTDSVKSFVDKMGPVIEEIIIDIQKNPKIVTDSAKRKEAIKRIISEAKDAGFASVKASVVNVALEMVLQALKNRGELGENAGEK